MSASLRDLGRRADALPTTHFDATDLMRQAEFRLRRRRLVAAACAVIAVVVVLGTTLLAGPDTRDADPPPAGPPSDHPASDHWVLVGGELLVGADEYKGDWSEPLPKHGVRTYPDFMSADPATHRFLVIANPDVTAWNVMTPGQREPFATFTCASAGCHAVALGPGPDELTMRSSDGVLVVIGPDGRTRRELGPAWTNAAPGQGFLHDEAWSP